MKRKPLPDVTISLYLDVRSVRQNGLYPVTIRIYWKRMVRFYTTGYQCSKAVFKHIVGEKPRKTYRAERDLIEDHLKRADALIKQLDHFSFEEFAKNFQNKISDQYDSYPNSQVQPDLPDTFRQYIAQLKQENRLGSAEAYTSTLQSLLKYHPDGSLSFALITPFFLKEFERWMVERNRSITTIGIYMRCLRHICHIHLNQGDTTFRYPFGSNSSLYRIPQPRNIKKALTLYQIQQIFAYEAPKQDRIYKDLWIFSYLCNGINPKDIFLLQYKDLGEETIHFTRSKTASTNRNAKPIVAIRTDHVNAIIQEWGTNSDQYIFPFLTSEMTAHQKRLRVQEIVKRINRTMKRIAKELNIEKITTYTARHSYATILKRSGIDISFISDTLGHQTIKTTESYLGSFELDEQKKIAQHLTNWIR